MSEVKIIDNMLHHTGHEPLPWISAGMCYADVPPRSWAQQLNEIRRCGFTLVDVVVPWRSHTDARGSYDFYGALSLRKFLDDVQSAGLAAALRLGPVASLTRPQFGLPDRILSNAATYARSHHGAPLWMPSPTRVIPVPSYDSKVFLDEAVGWIAAVGSEAAAHSAVVATIVDVGDHFFFRTAAFDGDYHPDAIAAWQQVHQGAPPKQHEPDNQSSCMAWLQFKATRAVRAATALRRAAQNAGWRQPCLAEISGASDTFIQSKLAAIFDGLVHRGPLRAVDTQKTYVVAQCSASRALWLPPTHHDVPRSVVESIAAGARGVAITGWLPSDHEIQSMGAAPNKVTLALTSLLSTIQQTSWPHVERQALTALVNPSVLNQCVEANNHVDLLSSEILNLVGLDCTAITDHDTRRAVQHGQQWHRVLRSALCLANVPFVETDDSSTIDQLRAYRVIIAPTSETIRAAFATTLSEIAKSKAATIVLGSVVPTADENAQPLNAHALPTRVGKLREASLDDIVGLANDLRSLAPAPQPLEASPGNQDVQISLFQSHDAELAIIINDSAQLVCIAASTSGWVDAAQPSSSTQEFFAPANRWLILRRVIDR
jgi:hypothetical protein